MPKPVLSDSLFNADDVATAVLAQANLQITNQSLGVTDISNIFVNQSGWSDHSHATRAYHFNGFVFLNINLQHPGGTPSQGETCISITDSNYHPGVAFTFATISYEGDYANNINITTSGEIKVSWPGNLGSSNYYIVCNGFYRI